MRLIGERGNGEVGRERLRVSLGRPVKLERKVGHGLEMVEGE